ncbi:MAG: hypothetical protein ACLPL5_13905 [Stellaceae bacterium]
MNRILRLMTAAAFAFAMLSMLDARAADIKMTQNAGAYRVELNVLNAEPFGAPMNMGGMSGMSGMGQGAVMVAKGGATPVPPDAPSHPNHHLVVHVHDAASGKVITDAAVTISFTPEDASGKDSGPATQVPVVVMEVSGKGAASTHYGNNVTMPPGAYHVDVTVNGATTSFQIKA